MADCEIYREEIEETPDGLSRDAAAHAETCVACGALRREREGLRRLVGGLGRVEAPADFEYRLRARMAAGGNGGLKSGLFRLRLAPSLAWVAAAACFLAVSATLYLRQEGKTRAVASQPRASEVALTSSDDANAVRNDATKANGATANTVAPVENIKTDAPGAVINTASGGGAVASNRLVNKARGLRNASRPASLKVARGETAEGGSNVSDLSTAKVLLKGNDQTVTRSRMKPIRLRTSPEPLRFVVRDERGATRAVPVRTVSFGSQELVAGVNTRTRAARDDKGGVW